jgi:DnaK suppressor protein
MTRAAVTRADEQLSRTLHNTLVERYDRAHAAWSQQVAVANATRASRDIGPGDEADHASTYAHLGEQDALTDALRTQLDDLATAVQRSDNGSYGRCEGCGHAIPAARLDLFPAATYCVTCKQRLERR